MKVRHLFFLLLALFVPWAANAQTLTVYDDESTTNRYVPIDGYNVDGTSIKSEYIMPAEELAAMNGKEITKMTLYLQTVGNRSWGDATFRVFMKEVENTTISAFTGYSDATVVYVGGLDCLNEEMEVTFTENYTYNGGNLLIGFYIVTKGTYTGSSVSGYMPLYYGETVTGASIGGTSATQQDFLPKTTFTYQNAASCPKPSGLTVNGIVATWNAGTASQWNLQYKKTSESTWTPVNGLTTASYTFSGLEAQADYEVQVQADCGSETSEWTSSVNFTTPCDAITTLPWSEDFEDFTANTVPECWDNSASTSSDVTANPHYIWGAYSYDSNKMLRMYNFYAHTGTALINSQPITLPATGEYELSFDYAHNATCGAFFVKISEDGGTTFVQKGSYTKGNGSSSSDPGEFTHAEPISLASYVGKTIVIQFYATPNYGSGAIFVDNVKIDVAPTCKKPTGLECTAKTATTATLSWTNGAASQDTWQICLNGDETNLIEANRNPFTISTGLTPTTTYTAKVRAYCSETDQSEWSNTISFTTECPDSYPLDYSCGFEGPNTTGSYPMPMCWTRMGSSTNYPDVNTYNYHEGTSSLYFYKTSGTSYNNEIAALPAIDAEMNTVRVVFYGKLSSSSDDGTINVGYVTDLTDASSFQSVQTVTLTTSWEKYTVSFGNVGEVSGNIAFQTLYSTASAYIYIDDVLVETIPSCLEPALGEPSDITATTATLNWTQEGDVRNWDIRWRLNGSTGDYNTATSNTNSYQITTGLSSNTTYEYGVQAGCGSQWSTGTFTTACPEFMEVPFTENFDGISGSYYNSTNNLPQCWDYINASTNYTNENYPIVYNGYNYNSPNSLKFYLSQYYSNYDPQPQYAILPPVENVSGLRVKLYARANSTSYNYTSTFKVGVMEGTDASTFETIETITPTTTTYKEYIIPFDSYEGDGTRIAILMEVPSTDYAGVYIDNITVEQIPDCATPTDLAYSNTTPEGATITWTPGEGTEWTVQYKKTAESEWTTVTPNVTEATYTFTGLDFSTSYQARVSVVCTEGTGITYPTNPVSFTTQVQFPAPTNLVASNITLNSATLSWTPGYTNQTAWKVQYKKNSDSWTDDATIVSTPTLDIREGLEENTTYNVRIYGGIGEEFGTSSLTGNFTTKWTQGAPTDLVVSVTASSATLSWTPGYTTQDQWTVKYKKSTVSSWDDATTENVTEPTIILENLDGLTQYDVQIYYVEDNKLSGNFITAGAFPYTEDFTGIAGSSSVVISNVTGWGCYTGQLNEATGTATLSSATSAWNVSNTMNFNEPHMFSNVFSTSCYKWAVSPNLYCSAEAYLKFDLALTKYTNADGQPAAVDPTLQQDDKFIVLITKDNGATWTELAKWDNAGSERVYNDIATLWETVTLDINERYAGEYIRIAFYGESTVSGGDNNVHIDNIEIDIVQDCDKPVLAIDSYAATTADLSWSAGESTTTWTLNYKKTSDEEWTVVPDIATNHYQIPELTPEQAYEVRVLASCNIYWSNTVTFTTQPTCLVPYDVEANDVEAYSAAILWAGNSDSYTLQYREVITAPVDENVTYDFEDFTLQGWTSVDEDGNNKGWYVTSGSAYNSSYCAAAQYNSNAVPSDWLISPQIKLGGTLSFYAKKSSGTEQFQVYVSTTGTDISNFTAISDVENPTSAYTRYEYNLSDYSGNGYVAILHTGAIDQYWLYVDDITYTNHIDGEYGEWQTVNSEASPKTLGNLTPETTYQVKVMGICDDIETNYSDAIEFTTPATCPAPTELAVTDGSVTAHVATITWTENGEATTWIVEYADNADFTDALTETVEGEATYSFDELAGETTYYVRVKAHCDAEDESYYSNVVNFTTLVACHAPTVLTVTAKTNNSATLSWTENGTATAWQICLNDDEDHLIDVTTNPYTLPNLTAATAYTVKVRANCGGIDGESAWSNIVSFTTECNVITIDADNSYSEDFSTWTPLCWELGDDAENSSGNPSNWTLSSGAAYSGYYGTIDLYMPTMNIVGDHASLTFQSKETSPTWYTGGSNDHGGLSIVKVSTDNGTTWTQLWCPAYEDISTSYKPITIELDDYLNQDILIAFEYQGDNAHGWYIDDVEVTATNAPSTITQTIELVEGWNWVSIYIDMSDGNGMAMLEEALGDNAIQIVTEFESADYFGDGEWVGLEGYELTNGEMVLIEAESDCTVTLEGMPADPATVEITLNPGWNWIGFPFATEMDIEAAFADFEPEDEDMISDTYGSSDYLGEWVGDVMTIVPGQGYFYYNASGDVKTLVFSTGAKKVKNVAKPDVIDIDQQDTK